MDQLGVSSIPGALHLGVGHHGGKVEAALSHEGLPATLIRAVDAEEASTLAGCRVGAGAWFASARSVSGPEYVEALLDHGNIEFRSDEPTTPACEETPMLWCTGSSAVNRFGLAGLHQIRGQLEVLEPIPGLNHAVCFGHYLLPGEDAVVLGASYDHGDSDPAVRDDTAQASLELAKAALPGVPMRRTGGRTSFRLASRDRLPLLGPGPQGHAWFSLAHGSRGASTGPFLGLPIWPIAWRVCRGACHRCMPADSASNDLIGRPWLTLTAVSGPSSLPHGDGFEMLFPPYAVFWLYASGIRSEQ